MQNIFDEILGCIPTFQGISANLKSSLKSLRIAVHCSEITEEAQG